MGTAGTQEHVKDIVEKLWLTIVDSIFQNDCICRMISDTTIKNNCICVTMCLRVCACVRVDTCVPMHVEARG